MVVCICKGCDLEKPHYAKGMCRQCYREIQENRSDFHSPIPETKVCAKCNIEKVAADFSRRSSIKDGLDSYCRECMGKIPKKIITCDVCGNRRERHIANLCGSCGRAWQRENPTIGICKACGMEKAIYSKEMCQRCYSESNPPKLSIEELRERKRAYYNRHKEEQNIRDRIRNQDPKRIESQRKRNWLYNILHAGEVLIYQRKYRKENPEKVAHWTHQRKARKLGLPCTLTMAQWEELKAENNFLCYYCGNPPPEGKNFHHEHRLPESRGGGYTKENIIPACPRCNLRKHDKTEDEFIRFMRTHRDEFTDAKWIR